MIILSKENGKIIKLQNGTFITNYACVVGKKEKEGPLGEYFDLYSLNSLFGEPSYEKAESMLQQIAIDNALKKAEMQFDDIDAIFAGDLLNQCIGSSFGLRETEVPFIGVYGACSTMALTLGLAAVFVDNKCADRAIACTSSHFCSSERQYRFPLEYGSQRTPTAQWTVTGAAAIILSRNQSNAKIERVLFGAVQDLGVKDANNMGAAMAPAAADTIKKFFWQTNTKPSDYDEIFTGDLGAVGSELLYELLEKENIYIREKHNDCGLMIYDRNRQDTHAGGSGCGCSASVLAGYILKKVESGEYKNILFCATGALLSPTSTLQGEDIPSIAHIIQIVNS